MKRSFLGQYLFNIALAFDEFANAILLGDPDDTISGRCGRAIQSGKPKWFARMLAPVVDFIFLHCFDQVDHCKNAIDPNDSLDGELWKWYKD